MRIFKFGGASVKDAEGVKNVANIIRQHTDKPLLVVVSAMGKTTNLLEALLKAHTEESMEKYTVFKQLKQLHYQTAVQLFENEETVHNILDEWFTNLYKLIEEPTVENYDFEYDRMVSFGELISTTIVSHYMQHIGIANQWIDARQMIRTDNTYREAIVDWEKTQRKIKRQLGSHYEKHPTTPILTQGFIGGTTEGLTTTLGREGSDFSAAIFGYSLNAKDVTIWKDVDGLLNADPKQFADTIKLDKIPYGEAIELSYYGASIIHPKTLKPLQNKKIPLKVKSFIVPNAEGSIIGDFAVKQMPPCFICKKNQMLISIMPKDFSFIAEENLSTIFGLFAHFGIKINLMQNSALSFSVCVDEKNNIEDLIEELQTEFYIKYNENMELITIRHYDKKSIDLVLQNRTAVLEQKNRTTVQYVLKKQS